MSASKPIITNTTNIPPQPTTQAKKRSHESMSASDSQISTIAQNRITNPLNPRSSQTNGLRLPSINELLNPPQQPDQGKYNPINQTAQPIYLQPAVKPSNVTDQLKNSIIVAYNAGNYSKAIKIFEKSKEFCNRVDLLTLVGDCYIALNDFQQADLNYNHALSLEEAPKNKADLLFKLAKIQRDSNQSDLALQNAQKALILLSDAILSPLKWQLLQFENEMKTAKARLTQPVQYSSSAIYISNEGNANAHLDNGKAYFKSKQFAQAIKTFDLGLKFESINDTTKALLLLNLGKAHSELGNMQASITAYQDALSKKIDQDLISVIISYLGAALLKEKRVGEAQLLLMNAINQLTVISGNNKGLLCFELAVIYEGMGKKMNAREALKSGLSDKENPIYDVNIKAKLYLKLAENYLQSKNSIETTVCINLLIAAMDLDFNRVDAEIMASICVLRGYAHETFLTPSSLTRALNDYTLALQLNTCDETQGLICLKLAKTQQKSGATAEALNTCKFGLSLNHLNDETRAKLKILIGNLTLHSALLTLQEAAQMLGVSQETHLEAENASNKLKLFLHTLESNENLMTNGS